MDVARRGQRALLFAAYGVMLLVSSIACGLAGHVGASRLLYSMGRDDVLPKKIFGYLSPKKSNPIYNVWIVGVLAYIGVITIPWEHAAEVVTFGALLAFMGVNLAALRHFWFSQEAVGHRNFFVDAFVPGFGFVFCFVLLLSLQTWTKYAGLAWLVVGILYGGIQNARVHAAPKTNRFQRIVERRVLDERNDLLVRSRTRALFPSGPVRSRRVLSTRDVQRKPARFADAQFRLQLLHHCLAAISRNAADEQFGGLASQLMLGQFHGGQARTENSQPGIIVKTHQPEILGTAQSHLFRSLQQSHGHQMIRHVNAIGAVRKQRVSGAESGLDPVISFNRPIPVRTADPRPSAHRENLPSAPWHCSLSSGPPINPMRRRPERARWHTAS